MRSHLIRAALIPTPSSSFGPIMQSFIGCIPVSTRFGLSLVPTGVGHALGRASLRQRFVEVVTAE